jgi:hypothetical protein
MADDANPESFAPPVWVDPDGNPLSCRDKIKVLNENLEEIRGMAQDALEDAILMGADEAQARATLAALVASLVNPYRRQGRS